VPKANWSDAYLDVCTEAGVNAVADATSNVVTAAINLTMVILIETLWCNVQLRIEKEDVDLRPCKEECDC
jgi:hypothetical protein